MDVVVVVLDACEDVPVGGCASWMRDRSTGWRLRLCRISGGGATAVGAESVLAVAEAAAAAAPPAVVLAMVAAEK